MNELWQKAVEGDKEAEGAIFVYLRERFTVIAGLTIYQEDAKDIAHEACLAVLEGYKAVGSPYQYSAWAQRVLKNKIADYFQRRSLEKRVFVESDFLETLRSHPKDPEPHEMLLTLQKCLKELTVAFPRYAKALHLNHVGYDTESICEKMKVTRSNLYVLLNRGRKFLRDCIFDEKSK